MRLRGFYLEKFYFDCIDESGNCFVLYRAYLRLSIVKLNYSGLIFTNSKNNTVEKSSLRKVPKPAVTDLLNFHSHVLKTSGEWKRTDPPVSLVLYTDERGRKLSWNCHHPKSRTTLTYNGRKFCGLGYAETLTLPIKPWNLPIDELRWGRFLSERFTIIWIHWKGKYPVNKLFCNGSLYEDAAFENDKLVFDSGSAVLSFLETGTIRKGKLSGVLAKMPWLKVIFNSRILNTVENKYKARSSFSRNAMEPEMGWSLFEVVTWVK